MLKKWISLLLVFLVSLPTFLIQTAYAAATEPFGLNAITSFERLPYFKTDTMAGGQSSYARDGQDWNEFMYQAYSVQ
jgi:hypothetical protein